MTAGSGYVGAYLGYSFVPTSGGGEMAGGGTALALLDITPAGALAGTLDQLLDPTTLDYVRTDNGEWAETADSRTTMMIMLELEFGASPFDPGDGTRLKALLREGDPVTPDILQIESLRAGRILQGDGIISDLTADVYDAHGQELRDESGRSLVIMRWRDLASGSPLDLVFQPR